MKKTNIPVTEIVYGAIGSDDLGEGSGEGGEDETKGVYVAKLEELKKVSYCSSDVCLFPLGSVWLTDLVREKGRKTFLENPCL